MHDNDTLVQYNGNYDQYVCELCPHATTPLIMLFWPQIST
jgi:hypothetical protein